VDKHGGKAPAGRIVIKDRIADAMFLADPVAPEEYSVLAMPNPERRTTCRMRCWAQVVAWAGPGCQLGGRGGVFEATHGTAPKYAGQDKVKPGQPSSSPGS